MQGQKPSIQQRCLCQREHERNSFVLSLRNISEKSKAPNSAAVQSSMLLVLPKEQLLVGNMLQPQSSKHMLSVLRKNEHEQVSSLPRQMEMSLSLSKGLNREKTRTSSRCR